MSKGESFGELEDALHAFKECEWKMVVKLLCGTAAQHHNSTPPPRLPTTALSSIPLSSHVLPQPQLFWASPPWGVGVGGDGASEGIQMFSTVNVNHNDSKLFSTCIQNFFLPPL